MFSEVDKQYFSISYNEQMSLIGEEVEHIIRFGEKAIIWKQGEESYGNDGYTHSIKRLFTIIKADPKNVEMLSEIIRAESELKSFLYNDTPSEQYIFDYWNRYLWGYVNELRGKKND